MPFEAGLERLICIFTTQSVQTTLFPPHSKVHSVLWCFHAALKLYHMQISTQEEKHQFWQKSHMTCNSKFCIDPGMRLSNSVRMNRVPLYFCFSRHFGKYSTRWQQRKMVAQMQAKDIQGHLGFQTVIKTPKIPLH